MYFSMYKVTSVVKMLICRRSLLLVCFVVGVKSFRFEEGCTVKQQWEDTVVWPEIHFSSWVPKHETGVAELKIFFKGKEDLTSNDKIILKTNNYTLDQMRSLTSNLGYGNISTAITDGWNDFVIYIDGNYSLWYGSQIKVQVLQVPIDPSIKSLQVKGSNITLNCHSDVRAWKVSGSPVAIPFDNSREQKLTFYSDSTIQPYIKLGWEDIKIRWDGRALTAITDQDPLPSFMMHNITLSCTTSESTTCTIKESNSDTILKEIPLRSMPDFILVGGENGNIFYALLRKYKETTTIENTIIPNEEVGTAANGGVVGLAVALVIALIIIAALIGYKFYRSKKRTGDENNMYGRNGTYQIESSPHCTEKYSPTTINVNAESETQPLLQRTNEVSVRADETDSPSHRDNVEKEKELMNAVIDDVPQIMTRLLKEFGESVAGKEACRRAYIEAHLLGHKESIKLLDSHKFLDRETLIQRVQNEYNRKVDLVFEAAQKGFCWRGVAHLLDYNKLPATIRNPEGLSLLHIIVSTEDISGGPLWRAKNLRHFLQDKSCFANAVDYEGQTCLHRLGIKASHSKTTVEWDSEKMTVEEAWKSLAKIIVDFGCDPSITDDKGKLPHEYAKEHGNQKLCDFLKKAQRQKKSNKKNAEKFDLPKFVKEVEKGDTTSVMDQMLIHPLLLPMDATSNPLTKSIMTGNLEMTLILLCGGAHICGHSRTSITPLEASHGAKSLPAIFPALMRMECKNRLMYELTKVGKLNDKLHQHIKHLMSCVEKGAITPLSFGDQIKTDEERSKEAREMLCIAAKLGLSLTCQMFGLINVNLQTYPDEVNPIKEAVKSKNLEIVYVLSRDLHMFIFSPIDNIKLSKTFLNGLWDYEVKRLKQALSKFERSEYYAWLDSVKAQENESEIDEAGTNIVLANIAQYGLVYMLHVVKGKIENFNVNAVVDDLTGCTMLHIAAMYGQSCMLEYLLKDANVDIMSKCKRGFTASHWAAFRGHKDCMQYLQFFMKRDHGQCEEQIHFAYLAGYQSQLNDYKAFLISNELALEVWSSPLQSDKAKLLLKNSFSKHEVIDRSSFETFIDKFTMNADEINNDVLDEMKDLLKKVSEKNPQFQGNMTAYQSNVEGLKLPTDSITIYWEVTSKVFNDFERKSVANENYNFTLSFKNENLNENFKPQFYEAVASTLQVFQFKSSDIWPLFPCIQKHLVGVMLYLAKYNKEKGKSSLMKVVLVPVLKIDCVVNKTGLFKHPTIKDCSQKKSLYFIANVSKDKWSLVSVKLVDEILKHLEKKHCAVLRGCKLLMKILYSCWWLPNLENRRHHQTWNSHSISLSTLTPNELTSFFLEEINNVRDEDWVAERLLDRMTSIFNRATRSNRGDISSETIAQLFCDSNYSFYKTRYIVRSTIKMLNDLEKA